METNYYYGEPLRLTAGPQLLLDDALVEDRWRLRRVMHCPEKHMKNPLLLPEKPWEGDYLNVPVVLWDEDYGKFRMWYGGIWISKYVHEDVRRKFIMYAESDDGIHWEKPMLDICPVPGHPRNNILYQGAYPEEPGRYGVVCDQVIIDRDDPDPARRYKMITYEGRPDGKKFRRGINLAISPDGLRWKLEGAGHILDYNSDTSNNCTWDPVQRRWLMYVRPRAVHASGLSPHEPTPGFHPAGRHHSRRVAVMTSPDFRTWSYPRTCLYPDERDVPDYDATSVFKCGSHFIMLYTAMNDDVDGKKDVKLASSADGFHWTRFHTREPFIARGRPGDFDAGQIMRISSAPPVQRGAHAFIYYTGSPVGQHEWHGQTGFGVVRMTPGRFAMQWADDEPAWLITREFVMEGNRLRVNIYYPKTKNVVHVLKAEIVQHPPLGGHGSGKGRNSFRSSCEGFTLADCDLVKENSTEALVTWKGNADLSAFRGKPIYLRFELRNMGIFSFSTPLETDTAVAAEKERRSGW